MGRTGRDQSYRSLTGTTRYTFLGGVIKVSSEEKKAGDEKNKSLPTANFLLGFGGLYTYF